MKIELEKIKGGEDIIAAGYNEKENVLAIQFSSKGNPTYNYYGVPAKKFDDFMESAEKRAFFTDNIRNKHEYRKQVGGA